jgi:hypothetical protein
VNPHTSVCIAAAGPQDLRIFKHHLKGLCNELIVFDASIPSPDKFNLIIIDCQHLDASLHQPLQSLLLLNKKSALVFIGQLTDNCEFVLRKHTGKIFHLQKGTTFEGDLLEILDEIHVPYAEVEFSLLQKFRQAIFKYYGITPLHLA